MADDDGNAQALEQLTGEIQSLRSAVEQKKKRDFWDISGIVLQALSGVVIAGAGIYLSNSTQQAISRTNSNTQMQIAELTRVSDYLKIIVDTAANDDKRASLVSLADLAIPDNAYKIGMRYATTDPSDKVRIAAVALLGRLQRTDALKVIADNTQSSDPIRDAARNALGELVREIRVRASQIDDLGTITVNGKEVLKVTFNNDSGWVDVSSTVAPGHNEIKFALDNGPYGGWSGRFELSAGGHLYDSGQLAQNACPCNARAFEITIDVQVAQGGNVQSISDASIKYF